MVHADCPRGYRDVNGICVPLKSRQVRSSQYLSLFSNDGGGGGSDDVYVPYVPSGSIPEDDIISGGGGDDGRDEPITELVDDGGDDEPVGPAEPHTPAERPDVPDHNVVVPNDEPLTEEQIEINFIMDILLRQGNTAALSQSQLQVLANANAEQLLTVKQRAEYIQYISHLDDVEMSNVRTDEVDQIAGRAGDSLHTYTYTDPLTQEVTSGTYHLNQHGIILYNEQGEMFKQYRAADATFSDNVIYNNNLDIDLPSSYTYNPSMNQNTLVNDPLDYVDDAIHEVGKAISNAFDPSKI